MEGSPAVEVKVFGRGGVHVDIEVARLIDSHVIEGRVGSRGEAVVLPLVGSCAFVRFGALGIISVAAW